MSKLEKVNEIKEVNDDSFEEEVLKNEGMVLVDFGADWCGPCRSQLPVLEKFAAKNTEVKVVKMNIDDSPKVAKKYGVRSIPFLVLFDKGAVSKSKIGLSSLDDINGMIK